VTAEVLAERPAAAEFYRTIRLIRRFEERSIELVKSGDIVSGIHPCIGQEAVAAGVGAALRRDDVLIGNHRGHGHMLAKGTDPGRLLAEMVGRAGGIDRGRGGSFHPSDFSVGVYGSTGTVGHGVPIAAGAAWALAQAGTDRIAVAIFGDGAVNQGAWFEGLNLAALWHVPAVFICENNFYATTVPLELAMAGTMTGRAEAFGIPAASCDGMDPDVVFDVTAQAVRRARGGGGPSFIEFTTYRYHGHHTFELNAGLKYRDEDEVARWRARDPLDLLAGRVPAQARERIDAEVESVIEAAARFALDSPRLDPGDGLEYLYSSGLRLRGGATQGDEDR